MADDKNFLQTIKLEISRTFKLDPYERMAFHKLLGSIKSQGGRDLLIRELKRDPDLRRSALAALARFDDNSLIPVFTELLSDRTDSDETALILDYFRSVNAPLEGELFINLIEALKNRGAEREIILKTFETMGRLCFEKGNLAGYLHSIVESSGDPDLVCGAIMALSWFRRPDILEGILKKDDPLQSRLVFDSIFRLNTEVLGEATDSEEGEYSPADRFNERSLTGDEELLLQIKVLLGRFAPRYDTYPDETRISLINAMLSCNHRESVIYALKGLESKDTGFVNQVLYLIYNNITRLRAPEKLLRSLIGMNLLNDRNNILVIDIFNKYFSEKSESRTDILFRDKQFGYISASLESFFETYRREFMIPDVVENSFPENFQKIRGFILKKLNPDIKRKITDSLTAHDFEHPGKLMDYMSGWLKYAGEVEREPLSLLIDVLLDQDRVSREKSAGRIDSVNFDKIYLQKRIIRLCGIVSRLNIESAARSLVYIYNYLKKYPEPEILEAAIEALCRINYSYMLSEVEIMITAGSPEDQARAVRLLPLFTEKRLINIITEYLKNNSASVNDIARSMIGILSDQDIKSNVNVIAVFKVIIENNPDTDTVSGAVYGLGNCGLAEDIEYLNRIFHDSSEAIIKESAVKAIASIIARRNDYNRQQLLRFVQEYLKDSNIRVRIFSCMVLIRLGNLDALRVIRDMLTIKNKAIQREIFTILSDIKSPDFYFFLVSLLREEYGISRDIISLLENLPGDELKEIETFIINLFRKFDMPAPGAQQVKIAATGIIEKELTVLYVTIENYRRLSSHLNFYDLIKLHLKIDSLLLPLIKKHNGTVSHKSSYSVTSWFSDPGNAVITAEAVRNEIKRHNDSTLYSLNIEASIIVTDSMVRINKEEIFDLYNETGNIRSGIPVMNRVILNSAAAEKSGRAFYSTSVPEILYTFFSGTSLHFELISPVNFPESAYAIIQEKEEAIEKKREMDLQIEAQVKSLNMQGRSTTSIAIAGELENVGLKLKDQLDEIERYVSRRSTDRELNRSVRQMLNNVYNLYRVETSKLIIK